MNFESLSQVKFLLIRKHEICFWSQSLRISFLSFVFFAARKWTKKTALGIKAQKSESKVGKWKNFFNLHKITSWYRGFNGAVFFVVFEPGIKIKNRKNASREQRFIIYKASFKLNSCWTDTKKKHIKFKRKTLNIGQLDISKIKWHMSST